MIELLKWVLFGGITLSWVFLFIIFWELGITTWKMGEKLESFMFFLADLAIIFMFSAIILL